MSLFFVSREIKTSTDNLSYLLASESSTILQKSVITKVSYYKYFKCLLSFLLQGNTTFSKLACCYVHFNHFKIINHVISFHSIAWIHSYHGYNKWKRNTMHSLAFSFPCIFILSPSLVKYVKTNNIGCK